MPRLLRGLIQPPAGDDSNLTEGARGRNMLKLATILLVLCAPPGDEPGKDQDLIQRLTKDQRTMYLDLQEAILNVERAIHTLQKAEDDYDQTQKLLEEGIYTRQDREVVQAYKALHDANYELGQSKIDLEKRKLEFFKDASHIRIATASKYSTRDDVKRVRLVLRNTSDFEMVEVGERLVRILIDELEQRLIADEVKIVDGLLPERVGRTREDLVSLLKIENIIVSVLKDRVNIGRPYEVTIRELAFVPAAPPEEVSDGEAPDGEAPDSGAPGGGESGGDEGMPAVPANGGGPSPAMGAEGVEDDEEAMIDEEDDEEVAPGTVEIEFTLQQDVDDLTVKMDYLGKQEEKNVYLETQAKEDIVTVTSQQFAQEGELGNRVAYDFALERLTEGEKEFRLLTLGLPEKYHHRFIDRERGGAAVRRVKFTRRMRRINLALEVDIPRELPADELLKPIKFLGVITDASGLKKLRPFLEGGEVPSVDTLRAARVGFEQLELVPRGIGEMRISARQYFYRAKPDDEVEIRFFIENTGTSRLTDIHFEVIPSDPTWRHRLEPEKVDAIEPAQKTELKLVLSSERPMEIGQYSLEVEATCELLGQEILAEEDNFRVQVEGETDVTLAAVILGTFLALVVGIAVMSIKISRR